MNKAVEHLGLEREDELVGDNHLTDIRLDHNGIPTFWWMTGFIKAEEVDSANRNQGFSILWRNLMKTNWTRIPCLPLSILRFIYPFDCFIRNQVVHLIDRVYLNQKPSTTSHSMNYFRLILLSKFRDARFSFVSIAGLYHFAVVEESLHGSVSSSSDTSILSKGL